MVRFFESNYTYYYSFPAVTLAYFLRYPNPYSTHVLSTDVISRSIDPDTGRLFTLRLHRKASRVPSGVKKFLPKSALESMSGDSSDTFVLETSEVDIKEGWMRTESRNLDWTSILSVVEKQEYRREAPRDAGDDFSVAAGKTEVVASVKFVSGLGDRLRGRGRKEEEEEEPKKGFWGNWGKVSIQRSIEAIASRKTENQLGKSKEGMIFILERLRRGGLVGAFEGIRKDRETMFGKEGVWKKS